MSGKTDLVWMSAIGAAKSGKTDLVWMSAIGAANVSAVLALVQQIPGELLTMDGEAYASLTSRARPLFRNLALPPQAALGPKCSFQRPDRPSQPG